MADVIVIHLKKGDDTRRHVTTTAFTYGSLTSVVGDKFGLRTNSFRLTYGADDLTLEDEATSRAHAVASASVVDGERRLTMTVKCACACLVHMHGRRRVANPAQRGMTTFGRHDFAVPRSSHLCRSPLVASP